MHRGPPGGENTSIHRSLVTGYQGGVTATEAGHRRAPRRPSATLPLRWGRAGEGGRRQGDDLGGVGDLAEDGPLEEEAVADHADEAGSRLVGDVGGDAAS